MRFPFDTVITGAGISMDAPSSLPSGDRLALEVWLSLFPESDAMELRGLCRDALPEQADADNGLRLEYLLEILGGPIGLEPLIKVYDLLDSSRTNLNHRLIASLPSHRHFTLNMDTLLEAAGLASSTDDRERQCPAEETNRTRTEVVHLHGRWDRPSSISTTISQYLNMLPSDLRADFVGSVAGRNVLVMGYSGRDFDVFPELVANAPRRLVWLRYPGSSMATEVETELNRLRNRGCRVECPEATVGDYLSPFVTASEAISASMTSASDGHQVKEPPHGKAPDSESSHLARARVENALAEISLSKRALATARVLFELGAFEALDKLAELKPCTGVDAALLRKVQARAQRRRGHNLAAMGLLLRPPTDRDAARVTLGNVNEVANLLTRVGMTAFGRVADRALIGTGAHRQSEPGRRFQMQATVRYGQDLSVRGHLADAAERLASVTDAADVRKVIGLSGHVDAMTWLLDAMKAQGRYEECLSIIDQMEPMAPYTNLSQRAYAYWQIGSVRLLTGDVDGARSSLEAASAIAEKSKDRQAQAWVVATLSDAWRDEVSRGRAVLDAATGVAPHPEDISGHYLARQYMLVQLAEQARVEGDLAGARQFIDAAANVRAPGRLRRRHRSMNMFATWMVRLLIEAEQDISGWEGRAEKLHADYLHLGARVAAADVSLLLLKVTNRALPAEHPRPTTGSWQDTWLQEPWRWRRPWHVIA